MRFLKESLPYFMNEDKYENLGGTRKESGIIDNSELLKFRDIVFHPYGITKL